MYSLLCVCVYVCLFVCLFTIITRKVMDDLDDILRR